ncbi:SDR family NAD(P)-dependent oxidoreductase [Nocardioides mangrovicus]|uniref:SDR family NAD(P)-dependent oxidoreductase n=1 Tax=Nocardioides mangrovicus TaxID=2478913 RepID=A0A3L8P3F7_9ACTN|nr:SDR family oxidoreductase [Nocardioides mangrovicus]RLV49785.1 SDR family NAD(P)-dependent oxidoreductase [Nocardioides mangrovicus]
MDITGSTALVTGANRGLGREFAAQLLQRGAAKVYAAARDPRQVDVPGVEPMELDLLDPASIERAAAQAADVTLLVNNAGVTTGQNLVRGDLAGARREMDVNFWGTLGVTRAFADGLGRHGGGAVLNVLSALSWFSYNGATAYAASKAAEWSLTNATRVELAAQGTQVTGVALGAADTDMMAGYDGPLLDPADVVRIALDGLAAGVGEVLVDDWSRTARDGVASDPVEFYARVAAPGL